MGKKQLSIGTGIVLVALILGGVWVVNEMGFLQKVAVEDEELPYELGDCILPSAPSVTLSTPDLYGGAAVTTRNMIRQVGTASWTDVVGAATFTADPGDIFEIVFGINSSEDDAQPYGPKITYTVPCKANPTVERTVVDDSAATSLVVRAWDPEDGTVISDTASVDIDNGDVMSIKVEWQGVYEEDFGNRWCEIQEGKGNVMIVEYNTTQYTRWKAVGSDGNEYLTTSVPTLESVATGYTVKAFQVPTLSSNQVWTFYLVADASGTGKEPNGATGNVTVNLFDVSRFVNNDVSPSIVVCGVEDEDGSEVGATAADSLTIYVEVE